MDENRFRSLMREAIGEESMQPWVASAVRDRLLVRRPNPSRLPWLVGTPLVLVIAAVFLVAQLTANRTHNAVVPAASPSTSPVAVDPSGCRLPVLLANGQAGFIDTSSAGFNPDASAGQGAQSYSPAARKWVPVPPRQVSPDGERYASTQGHQVHVTDIASGEDRVLWTAGIDVYIWRWGAEGVFVTDQLPPLPGANFWLVDPATGAAAQAPIPATAYRFTPLAGDPHGTDGTSFHSLGFDGSGRSIWWFFNLDKPGAADWVFYETAPGQRVYIYKGTQGDAMGFDPDMALADSTGIWFFDRIHNAIWHWQVGGELTKVQPPPRAAMLLVASIAGPCS